MAAVNWFCLLLVLAFAFINGYVCIKVDPNIPNGNYTTISLNGQQTTILPYKVNDDNEPDNITLLGGGDTELSASERRRRLIPYMAFYVPVSQLPINKQYAISSNNHNHNNIHMTKQQPQQAFIRPASATGVGSGGGSGPTGPTASTHIPIPPQYVHNTGGLQYLPAAGPATGPTHSVVSGQNYQPNAGLGYYQTNSEGISSGSGSGYGGGGHLQSQAQYHLLPPTTTGHSQYLQPPGPSGPSVLGLPAGPATNKANGNQAFVTFKEVKGHIRHKTVQHFPPLSATASSVSSASASLSVLKQQQQQQQLKSLGVGTAGIAASAAGVYRPRTKQQSKINLTPFTPANSVPGNFVPIVYTPLNTNNNHNNNNNNNNLHSPTSPAKGIAPIDDTQLFNHNENQQQQQQQQQQYHKQTPIEYSSGPLPPTAPATAISVPIHVPSSVAQRQHPHHHHHHNPTPVKQQQQSQYFSVTTSPLSPVNVDLTHDVGAVANSGENGGGIQHPHAHHHHLHQNTPAISPLPTTAIYHQNPQQQQQAEHVIIDAAHQQPQTVTLIGSKQQEQQQQQQQQQQFYHDKSVVQFQPPKPESFFESEIHIRQQQQQQQLQQQQHRHHHHHPNHQNIDQVLQDVNSYSIKTSHVMTPQEKYVMYLQQRMNYNKQQQQQQHYATRQKYRQHKHQEREQQQQQKEQQQQFINKQHQNPTQIFVLSSTISPSLDTPAIVAVPSAAAAGPIRPSSQPPPPPSPSPVQQHYDTNYPQHSPIHHDLYPKANPSASASGGGGGGVNGGGVVGNGAAGTGSGRQEHILTIPVHSLFGELETLQKQTHYSQTHSALPSPSTSHNNNKPYPKIGPSTPQYIDYIIDEPKQSLDDEHHQAVVQSHRNNQHSQHRQQQPYNQLELLKPTLGPPSHAFILVTTASPYPQDPVTQENYGSSVRPPYKSKPKIRLQPVLKENNVNYPAIRQQHQPTGRPLVVAITPTPKTIINNHQGGEEDLSTKYVYVNEEFGQKIPTVQGAVKLKPSNKYESDDNQISHQQQQQQQQHIPLYPPIHNVVNVEDATTLPPPTSPSPPNTVLGDPNELPDIRTSSLAEILHKLQESNHLPHTLTPDNIDNSIKTLIRILNNLKRTQTIVANPPQHHETPTQHLHPSSPDYDYSTGSEEEEHQKQQQHVEQQPQDIQILAPTGPNKHPGPSTGRPGVDYPNYAEIPETSFDCSQQRYKGFFGDPETNCQVWHYCDLNGGKASFLCPNGTIFSQIALTCDWWFNVKCATTAQLYVLNERLYKYILPFTPKFPEDYSGPLVDKYLAMKFQEMEEKLRLEKEKAQREESEEAAAATEHEQPDTTVTEESKEENHLDETTTEDNVHRQIKSHSTVIPISHKHESVNSQVSEQSSERNLLIDDEVNDISQRGKPDDFESTTISTMTATIKSDAISFSLKPIIVSSTLGPDYDDESVQHLDNKRSYNSDNTTKEITVTKTENETEIETVVKEVKVSSSTERSNENKMQISVEKVDVIEIKPDGATGHLIRDMLMHSKHNK